ncbi:MAG: RNA-binding protein [Methanobacteriaceae archaeon]|jgi:RNA binding exosome subunit|nr:RNA-binding protein [Candidatus Methanorudis spinitermitis]
MIHNIRYRLFVYKDEDENDLIEGLKSILPTVKVEREIAEGINGDNIIILSGKISKKRETKEFMNKLLEMDDFKIANLINDFEKKVDANGNLFLRFSKKDACNDVLKICENGDSIHLKVKIAAYPTKKRVAINLLNEFFTSKN